MQLLLKVMYRSHFLYGHEHAYGTDKKLRILELLDPIVLHVPDVQSDTYNSELTETHFHLSNHFEIFRVC